MSGTEAEARIKINKMLEETGWRLCDNENGRKNVDLETATKVRRNEQERKGAIDYLLLDSHNFPLCVLEAKKDSINPLSAKDQARAYAEAQGIRFVILSNSQIHYLWDIKSGNPQVITSMPSQESLEHKKEFKPNPKNLTSVEIIPEYVALLKNPNLLEEPEYQDTKTRMAYCWNNGYRILRPYQIDAVKAVQKAVNAGQDRFLLEMATGLGKTLTAGALIKLFLSTEKAKRVLFLVDRLELENQAKKNFDSYLNAYTSVIYKQSKSDWKKAQIVITTIQSLLVDNKYRKFSPTDFDLLISDEAHRCIGGNSRAVFEYFIGYKLGLTATPKDYIKNVNVDKLKMQDPKSLERRILLDSYKTFGCESGEPTFRYSLVDGVKGGYLINPVIVDARTEVTTDLLSEKGYAVVSTNEYGDEITESMYQRDFEKKFFSEKTNAVFCRTFLENALRDPISGEIGKSLVFGVSQNHCAKLVQILNEMADKAFPGMYNSDFAVQITSNVMDAQQSTIDFANDKLHGRSRFMTGYETSKTRICVTVGMMTTGYDCSDILNIALMRPVFSPTDFIQIKGRGTRKHTFKYTDENKQTTSIEKTQFKFFDFFANCQYFDEEFNYDEELKLPPLHSAKNGAEGTVAIPLDEYIVDVEDLVKTLEIKPVGLEGMRIDREFFQKAEETIKSDQDIKSAVDNENWDRAIAIIKEKYENQPDLYMNLEKIKKSQNLDRRVTWREVLEKIFGFIDGFKNKDDLLEDECDKFISIYKPEPEAVPYIKNFIKAYTADSRFREIIDTKTFPQLHFYAGFSVQDYLNLKDYKDILPTYIKENINLNTYM